MKYGATLLSTVKGTAQEAKTARERMKDMNGPQLISLQASVKAYLKKHPDPNAINIKCYLP